MTAIFEIRAFLAAAVSKGDVWTSSIIWWRSVASEVNSAAAVAGHASRAIFRCVTRHRIAPARVIGRTHHVGIPMGAVAKLKALDARLRQKGPTCFPRGRSQNGDFEGKDVSGGAIWQAA